MTVKTKSNALRQGFPEGTGGKDRAFAIAAYLVMAVVTLIPALLLHHPSSTVDELGFFSNVALLTGRDWTEAVHASGDFYFKYGISALYVLPFMLISSAAVRYRVCVAISGLLLSLTVPAAYRIARRHLRIGRERDAFWFALVACCPCAVIYQSNYVRADWALVLTVWLVLLCMLEAHRAVSVKQRALFTVLASVFAVWSFMCHTRGIVLVIALFLSAALPRLFFGIRTLHIPAYILSTGAALAADRVFTRFFKNGIWSTYGAGHASAEALDLSYLKRILTPEGFKILLKTIAGWLFSVSTSTLGLVLLGLIASAVVILLCLRSRESAEKDPALLLASLLGFFNFIGNMMLGILFFYKVLYQNFTGLSHTRADRMMYERYMICTLGILCILALCLLARKEIIGTRMMLFAFAVQAAAVAFCAKFVMPYYGFQETNRKMMVSVTTFFDYVKGKPKALLIAGLAGTLLFALWMFLWKRKMAFAAVLLLFAAYLGIFTSNWVHLRLKRDLKVYREITDVDHRAEELSALAADFPDVYVQKGAHTVPIYQIVLRDFNVINHNIKRWQEIEDMLIITQGTLSSPDKWDHIYQFADMTYKKKSKNDVLYVKGENLRKRVEEMGYELVPLSTKTK